MSSIPSAAPTEAAAWWHRYASLRIKTLSLIAATVLGLLLLLYIPLRRELQSSFLALETQTMETNVLRVVNAIRSELAALNGTTGDYATWDDTYQFIEDRNQDYIDNNIADSTLINNRLNYLLFYTTDGALLFGKGYDAERQAPQPVPPFLAQSPPAPLLALPELTSAVSGVLLLPDEMVLFASRPIITTEGGGPSRGALVMTLAVDGRLTGRLATATSLSVALFRADDPALPPDVAASLPDLAPGGPPSVSPLDARRLAGYALLPGLAGRPGLVVRVEIEREIYARSLASQRYLTLAMLLGGLVLGAAVMLLIERIVLSRLVQLDGAVGSISAEQGLAARVPVRGHDELAGLSRSINLLLDGVQQAQERHLAAETARQELQDRTIQSQSATLAQLSTPLIPINRRVLALPLIGEVDGARADRVLETILRGASERRAAAVILDITGVTAVGPDLIGLLARAGQAVRLIGAQLILTGLGADAAQALVEFDADLAGVVTRRDLEAGIAFALGAG